MTTIEIRLLGGFDVEADGRSITDFESGSTRALLARLAAEPGRRLPRSSLAELLWPDRPQGAAAGNLRHCLSTLRRAIDNGDAGGPVLLASRTHIALDPGASVDVDLTEFHRLAATAPTEPGAVAAWEAAVELRRGPFLSGFDVQLSEGWDTWVLTTRRAVEETTASLLRRLAELRERTGEYELALDHVRSWIGLDPWNEHAHRLLLRLLALVDQRGAALVHAETLTATLEAELGIEPSQETQAIVDDIRAGRFPVRVPELPDLAPRTIGTAMREPCVGRDDELRWLQGELDDTQTGAGRVIFVVGQAGSGKTVLLQTFERDAVDRMPGLVVARGSCNGFWGRGDPFLPFRQILGQLLGDVETEWTRGLLSAGEVARLWRGVPAAVESILDHGPYLLDTMIDTETLVARFEQGFPDHALTSRLKAAAVDARQRRGDPTRRRHPVVEQCDRVLASLAVQHPLLLTIDDLQWADAGTLDVLLQLAAGAEGLPMLVVAALRPGDFDHDSSDPVRATVNEILGRGRDHGQLEVAGSRAFVDAWLDSESNSLDEAFRAELYRMTDGNALFTVEVVRALQRNGRLVRDERGRWSDSGQDHDQGLPARVDAAIEARLATLPVEVRRDLDVAGLQGLEFSAELVAEVRGETIQDVVLRLGGLCVTPSGLLQPGGSEMVGHLRLTRFRFRHALFQQHLVDNLTWPVRRELHQRTGRALEEVHAGALDRVAGDLANHFDAAGLVTEAIEYHSLAGRVSSALFAYDDAIGHFDRALELLDTPGDDADAEQRELALLTALGACHQARSGYNAPDTTEVYERLRQLTEQVPASLESAGAIGALLTVDGLRGNYGDALAGAEQLLDLAGELGSQPIEAVARMQLGWMLLMVGRVVEADEQLAMAIDQHDPSWDDWLTPLIGIHLPSTTLAWRAIAHWHLGRFDEARRAGAESIASARAADFPFGLAFALSVGGCLLGELFEEPERITALADEVAMIAQDEDLAFYAVAADVHRHGAQVLAADAVDIVEWHRALERWVALGTEAFVAWAQTWLAEALVRRGDLDAAGQELAEVDRRLAGGEERLTELRRLYVEGMLRRADGDTDGAAAAFGDVVALARAARCRGPQLQAEAALARLRDNAG